MDSQAEGAFGANWAAELRRRAQEAALSQKGTFAIPEGAQVADFIAAVVPPGPLRAEIEGWLGAGASYHALVRLAAQAVCGSADEDLARPPVYVPKAGGELEPLLALWPSVLAVPTIVSFKPLELVALRALPVHPLGLVSKPTWADGRLCSPAEYFFHDLDHARFKIREDLRVEGVEIPDAYQGGTTLDPRTGRHRIILGAAKGRIGSTLWDRAESRRALAQRLINFAEGLKGSHVAAAELLLFEILCEKSYSLERSILSRELASDAHVAKIRRKQANGFYGEQTPAAATLAALDQARQALKSAL